MFNDICLTFVLHIMEEKFIFPFQDSDNISCDTYSCPINSLSDSECFNCNLSSLHLNENLCSIINLDSADESDNFDNSNFNPKLSNYFSVDDFNAKDSKLDTFFLFKLIAGVFRKISQK